MHWAAKYIGMPYEAGARGPDKVDCYGLVRIAYQEAFDITLPEFPELNPATGLDACNARIQQELDKGGDWIRISRPVDGCIAAMSYQNDGTIHHVGLYAAVDTGRIVHCTPKHPVVADTIRGLRLRGMKLIVYYRHRLWPLSSKHPTLSSPSDPSNTG